MKITAIHQIEITSRCNLKCKYCIHGTMDRTHEDMKFDVYTHALSWAAYHVSRGTQHSLNLCGIGESTLHPHFIDYVALARDAVGNNCEIVLATNGIKVTADLADAVAPYNVRWFVSLHRPEKAALAINILRARNVLSGVSADPALSSVDWAGQVKWEVTADKTPCPWQKHGWVIVLADGSVTRCAFDGNAVGVLCHVNDLHIAAETSPYSLCVNCHQTIGDSHG